MAVRSFSVEKNLKLLGAELRDARRRRFLSTEDMATRIGISRPTLKKMEDGDPKVSMGVYAMALMVFEKLNKLSAIFDDDRAAIAYLEAKTIPQRLPSATTRLRKKKNNLPK